jgi:MCP family monocarboxylic acid transporter-like MFS transporter 10
VSIGFIHTTNSTKQYSLCYTVALFLSTSKPNIPDEKSGRAALIDYRGFLDIRYTILCVGTFFSILGLWIPSYYISTL